MFGCFGFLVDWAYGLGCLGVWFRVRCLGFGVFKVWFFWWGFGFRGLQLRFWSLIFGSAGQKNDPKCDMGFDSDTLKNA